MYNRSKIASLRILKPNQQDKISCFTPASSESSSPVVDSTPLLTATPIISFRISPYARAIISPSTTDCTTEDDVSALATPYASTRTVAATPFSPVFSGRDLLSFLSEEEDHRFDDLLQEHGYKYVRKIVDTKQGAIYEATVIDPNETKSQVKSQRVAIKQTCKRLHKSRESKQDELNIIVQEDILKEASVLKHLTKDNRPNPSYIAGFIDFFEADDHYYLVMEYAGDCTLTQFVEKAHEYITQKKIRFAEYKKVAKFLFWQISVTIEYLHLMGVCHLDLSLDNLVVRDGLSNFVEDEAGCSVTINPNIAVKLVDFGLSEVFHPSCCTFTVRKWELKNSFVTTAPEVYAELPFDGKKADIWSAGALLYQILTGQPLYTIPDEEIDDGFKYVQRRRIETYLQQHGLNKYFGKKSLRLILQILRINENKRINAMDILKSPWFASYYMKYASVIINRHKFQRERLSSSINKKHLLPYCN